MQNILIIQIYYGTCHLTNSSFWGFSVHTAHTQHKKPIALKEKRKTPQHTNKHEHAAQTSSTIHIGEFCQMFMIVFVKLCFKIQLPLRCAHVFFHCISVLSVPLFWDKHSAKIADIYCSTLQLHQIFSTMIMVVEGKTQGPAYSIEPL